MLTWKKLKAPPTSLEGKVLLLTPDVLLCGATANERVLEAECIQYHLNNLCIFMQRPSRSS